MDIFEYQKKCKETAIYPGKGKFEGVSYNLHALAGELGEVSGKFSKLMRDSNSELTQEFRSYAFKEFGDILWHLVMAIDDLDLNSDYILNYNMEKLADRQKRGVLKGSGDDR